jgi:membrane dipeptidase
VQACVSDGLRAYQQGPNACNISDVVAQVDYLVNKIGIDHVGIGSDFDGISFGLFSYFLFLTGLPIFSIIGITILVKGLEDVSKYPYFFSALIEKGYKDEDINKVFYFYLLLFAAYSHAERFYQAILSELCKKLKR